MKSISLAIPFYNTSKYFLDCIKYAIDDNFVTEIIVNDDCSRLEDYNNLLALVKGKNKIKVYRNEINVGAFRNKYITVKKCTNKWVYLLDSDNHPFEDSYDIIRTIPEDIIDICYSPRRLFCKNDESSEYENIADYNFKYNVIGIEETKDAIFKQIKWFDWFVNSGNYIINRDMYLDSLLKPFEDNSTPLLYADTAAAYYFWLKNGGRFYIIDDLKHNHRLRPESYWNSCGINSIQSINYYKNQMVNL